MKLAPSDALIVSIDLPQGRFGGGYPKQKIPLYSSFARDKQDLVLLREDSHSDKTLEKAKKILNGKNIDFLFIDGDHSYEGVKEDFEMYGPLVKKGGIIAFHDIVDGLDEHVGGVPRFWREISGNYKHEEFIENKNQGGLGIGVLFVGE